MDFSPSFWTKWTHPKNEQKLSHNFCCLGLELVSKSSLVAYQRASWLIGPPQGVVSFCQWQKNCVKISFFDSHSLINGLLIFIFCTHMFEFGSFLLVSSINKKARFSLRAQKNSPICGLGRKWSFINELTREFHANFGGVIRCLRGCQSNHALLGKTSICPEWL